MKTVIAVVFGLLLMACQEGENTSNYTGNETVYDLQPTSDYNISGVVTFKEKRNGETTIEVKLTGTTGDSKLPVHLHLGDISSPGADVAALLSPVFAKTGVSITELSQLANETPISYNELTKLGACIKIHLSDVGPERDIILAGGNIGSSAAKAVINGKTVFAPCKSE